MSLRAPADWPGGDSDEEAAAQKKEGRDGTPLFVN